ANPTTFVAPLHWSKQKGVRKYRLQIAGDEHFDDVRFDGPVIGERYVVRDLPPGRYYWRIAPSASQTREYHRPVAFTVPGAVPDINKVAEKTDRRIPAVDSGWLATTGDVAAPMPASLQTGSDADFIGVNSQGTVYALDGSRGVALWTAIYKSNAFSKTLIAVSPFRPLVSRVRHGSSIIPIVIVAYDGGVRALNGTTGQELWRAELLGSARAGVVTEASSPASKAYLIVDNIERGSALVVMSTSSGRIDAQTKIAGQLINNAIGPPVLFGSKSRPSVLVPLMGGAIAVYDAAGQLLRTIQTGADITAAPVVVETLERKLMLVGTRKGLAVFSAEDDTAGLKWPQYIELGGEQTVRSLAEADVDGNGIPKVVAITNGGINGGTNGSANDVRVSLVDPYQMKVMWSVDSAIIASGAGSAAFADVNNDGRLDVLLPGRDDFAVALSGTNGSIIWKSHVAIPTSPTDSRGQSRPQLRSLAVTTLSSGHIILVGSDVASGGLRAIEVTPTTGTSNVR
ncbi:MAG: PQQ-binding-like beta-propeller repeat protein, partial [Acidobacteriota bacterium]|nr:PQQ-binding-like beta-propeller repeat protein [Acidobacteriota bacterium]